MQDICVLAAIFNLAAIFDFGSESEWAPNQIFTTFSRIEQSMGIVSPFCSTMS